MKRLVFTTISIFALCIAAFAQANKESCPKISISSTDSLASDEFIYFTADTSEEIDKYKVRYNWTVENLEILSGQSEKKLVVRRKNNNTGVARLEITGLPKHCGNQVAASTATICAPESYKIDEYGKIPQEDKKARIDNFLVTLNNNPNTNGFFVIANNQNSINEIKFYINYFKLKKFDINRIIFVVADQIEEITEIFLVPAGAENPTFENSLIIQTKDFDKLEKLSLPKPKNRKK